MKVLFLVRYGNKTGLGHLARCSVLAKAYQDTGHETYLISNLDSQPSINTEQNFFQNFTETWTSDFHNTEPPDSSEIASLIEKLGINLLVIDIYKLPSAFVREVKKSAYVKVLQISDGEASPYIDYLVDYGFDSTPSKYSARASKGNLLLGLDFALVSRAAPEPNESETRDSEPFVLLSLGGSERAAELSEISKILLEAMPNHLVKILAKTENGEFLDWVASQPKIRLLKSGETLSEIARKATFSIVSAGVSMYEAISSGKPCIALILAENQISAASQANLDPHLSVYDYNVFLTRGISVLKQVMAQQGNEKVAELVLKSAVDGFGPTRVVLLTTNPNPDQLVLRPSHPTDLAITFRWANDAHSRQNSFNRPLISAESHMEWFESLADRHSQLLIGEINNVPVGQVRLDPVDSNTLTLSFSIDPNFRGRGFSKKLIRELVEKRDKTKRIRAEVSLGNTPSTRALMSSGFKCIGKSGRGGIELELPALVG